MTSPGVVQSNNALKIFKTKFIPTLVYKEFPDPRQCMKICKISHQVPQSLNLSKKAAFPFSGTKETLHAIQQSPCVGAADRSESNADPWNV